MDAIRTALVTLLLCAALTSVPAAATESPHGVPHELTLEQAVKQVEHQYRARVVKAEAQKSGAHTTYALKLLNDSGKVWTVHVDAATGAVH
jgi:uncharacterized membrane protein YkoI